VITRTCKAGVRSFKCKAISLTPGMEHVGFVIYAGVEVVGLHAAIWWVSLLLFFSGTGAILYNNFFEGE